MTEADVLDFARTSGDFNPLHVDAAYAGRTTFRGRIAHGAYQVGLASALVGMYLRVWKRFPLEARPSARHGLRARRRNRARGC